MTCLGSQSKPRFNPVVGFRAHSRKHYSLSILSVSQICYQRRTRFNRKSDEGTAKCLSITLGVLSLGPSFPLPWSPPIHPLTAISSPPGSCLTNLTRGRSHFKSIRETMNEFLNQVLNPISNCSVTTLHSNNYQEILLLQSSRKKMRRKVVDILHEKIPQKNISYRD